MEMSLPSRVLASAAFVIGCLPAEAAEPSTSPEVTQHGEMRAVMRLGETQGRIALADVAADPNAFGVGAVAGLSGEITIANGKVWVSRVTGDGVVTTGPEAVNNDEATMLTLTSVPAWGKTVIKQPADGNLRSKHTSRKRRRVPDSIRQSATPFVLKGSANRLKLHIINGYCPVGVDPATVDAQPWRWSADEPVPVTVSLSASTPPMPPAS